MDRRARHLAALRDCLWSLVVLAVAAVVLVLALFVVDVSPHTPPFWPKSIGLSLGAAFAVIVVAAAITVRYRQHLAQGRRRDDET